jgi:MFS family permease
LIFMVGTFGMNFQITTALLAKHVFHKSASGYGLLSTALAVGACFGAVLAARRRARPSPKFLLLAAGAFGVLEVVTGLMPDFLTTAALLVPTGFLMITLATAANSSVQLGVEPTMRGRVMALYLICFMGGTPIGAPIIGWLAGVAGPRWGLIGGGLISAASAVVLGAYFSRRQGLGMSDIASRLRMPSMAGSGSRREARPT